MNHKEHFLEIRNLKKYYVSSKKLFSSKVQTVKALDDVSFYMNKGETFGIVGESGCGKSTLGKTVIRLLEPTSGSIYYEGTDITNLGKEAMRLKRKELQIIFQDPYASLNPRMTIMELIKAPLDVFNMFDNDERKYNVFEIMKLVGLRKEDSLKYPHEFSGGQRQRIVIARALILKPKFVFCDEPVSALDVSVRAQVLNLMKSIQKEFDLTYMFISHDLSVVRFLCDRVAVMYLGKFVELADKKELYENTKHPYTQALLSSIPILDFNQKTKKIILKGEIPSPYNPPSGCRFHTRCQYKMDICTNEEPLLRDIGEHHHVACHLY